MIKIMCFIYFFALALVLKCDAIAVKLHFKMYIFFVMAFQFIHLSGSQFYNKDLGLTILGWFLHTNMVFILSFNNQYPIIFFYWSFLKMQVIKLGQNVKLTSYLHLL